MLEQNDLLPIYYEHEVDNKFGEEKKINTIIGYTELILFVKLKMPIENAIENKYL